MEYNSVSAPEQMGLLLHPLRTNLYLPPIRWKGDPAGHVGGHDTFFWVVRGECYVMIDTESFIVKAGQLAFLPKGKMRTYSTLSEDLIMYEMNFSARMDGEIWYRKLGIEGSYVVDIADVQAVSQWFETSVRHEMNRSVLFEASWCTNLGNILCAYATEWEKTSHRMEMFREVLHCMDTHIDESLTIETLAAAACMQPTYFIRRFREAFGFTPIVYFNKLKVYRAMTLLATTDYSLQKIGERVGIGDAAYFSRVFKKYCGVSPTGYRSLFRSEK